MFCFCLSKEDLQQQGGVSVKVTIGIIKTHEDTRSVETLVANPLWLMNPSRSWSYARLLAYVQDQDDKASSSLILVEVEGLPLCLSNSIPSLKAEVARSFKNLLHG
jgi:hypothetical protein